MPRRSASNLGVGLATLVAPSAALAATPVPVGLWNMDNTFGTTMIDYSGNANDGQTTDIVTSGGGYIFNGTTSKAIVPDSPSLNPGTQDFSYSVQIQTDQVPPSGGDYDLLRKGLSATPGGEFKVELIRSDGKAKAFCYIKDSRGKEAGLTGKTDLADNLLHTITCARTGTTMTLKVDSLSALKKTGISVKSISNAASLIVGSKSTTGEGPIDNDAYSGLMRNATVSIAPAPPPTP